MLTEILLFGPQVAAEAAGIPCIVLGPTINVVPSPGVPPFGLGLMPATTDSERREHEELAAQVVAAWDEALPALNAARTEQGLEPLEHVLDRHAGAAHQVLHRDRVRVLGHAGTVSPRRDLPTGTDGDGPPSAPA